MSTLTGYVDSREAHLPKVAQQQGSGDDDAGKKKKTAKRRKVNHACLYCRRSHMTCDEGRPCQRWCVILPWNKTGDWLWILALNGILDTCVMMNRDPRSKTNPWNLLLLSQLHRILLVFSFHSLFIHTFTVIQFQPQCMLHNHSQLPRGPCLSPRFCINQRCLETNFRSWRMSTVSPPGTLPIT